MIKEWLFMAAIGFLFGAAAMGVFEIVTRDLAPDCRNGQAAIRQSHQSWACFDVQEITLVRND